jgi:hypothetical protein
MPYISSYPYFVSCSRIARCESDVVVTLREPKARSLIAPPIAGRAISDARSLLVCLHWQRPSLDPGSRWSDDAETRAESAPVGEREHQFDAPAKQYCNGGRHPGNLAEQLVAELWRFDVRYSGRDVQAVHH